MKVPVYEQQVGPQSVGLPAAESHGVSDAGLQQGLASLDRAGSVIMAKEREAEDKAIVAEVTDKETNLTRGITEDLHGTQSVQGESPGAGEPGYLSLQGRTAEANAAGFMDRIEKRRQALADSLKDDRAKKLFLARTGGDVENARRTVESHASQQRQAADVATLKARMGAAEESIFNAARIGDGATVQQQSIALEGPIKAQALSPEDAQRDVGLWQRRTVALQLDGFLDVKRVDVAEKLLEDTKGALGPELTRKYEGLIAIEKKKAGGDDMALQLIGSARKPNGFIDEAKAVAGFEALPKEDRSPEAKAAFDHLLTLEKARETSVKSDNFEAALSAYLQRQNINDVPASLKLWMIGDGKTPGNDPKAWQALLQAKHADTEHAKGAPPTDAQRRAMVQFETDLHDNPDKYAAMSEAQFNASVWPQLAKNDRERAGALFAASHGKPDKPGTLNPLENDMLLQKGREAGLFPPKGKDPAQWEGDSADLYYKATETLQAQAKQYRAHSKNHEPPPFELVKQWTDALVLQGKIPDKTFGAGTTRLEALTRGTGFEPDWKPEDVSKAVKALQKAGMPVNNETIDTMLRRVYSMPSAPVREPEQQQKPPSTVSDALERPDWGIDATTPAIDYGD